MRRLGISTAMKFKAVVVALVAACGIGLVAAQAPVPIDTAKIGPRIGQTVPPIEGVDQFGRRQTLASAAGTRGTMLVFFRSADW